MTGGIWLRSPGASTNASGLPEASRIRARDAAVCAQAYLLDRQSPGGGFCFYRWRDLEEPTLRDTWHAVAALTLLGCGVPRRQEVIAWLRAFRCAGLDDTHHRTLALARLDAPVVPEVVEQVRGLEAAAYLAQPGISTSARLQHALQIVTLQNALAAIRAAETVVDSILDMRRNGGWGDKPNLADTWLALGILAGCGQSTFPRDIRAFVDALQVPSFGFTATRDSLHSPLEVIHAGLRACSLLQLPARHLADAVGCVLACQSGRGGFARTADALPDIGLTHLGLLALAAAGALSVPEIPGWHDDIG